MSGGTYFKLLCLVAFSINTDANLGNVPLALPDRRSHNDYITKCDFGSNLATLCDWTSEGLGKETDENPQDNDPVTSLDAFRLKSGFLHITDDSCLEIWYHKPSQTSSELKVFLAEDTLQTLLWSSEMARNGDWRQVYIPLKSHSDNSVQVIFELSQGLRTDDVTAFDRVGIRKGQCGAQCQPGAEYWTGETTRCTCDDEQLTCSHMPWSKVDFTFGTCHVSSDSHHTSFDGLNVLLDNPCTYVLSRVCDVSGFLPEFSIVVSNGKKGDSSVSSVHQVNVNMQGLRVAMLEKERRRVMVNGIWRNVPLQLKDNTIVIDTEGNALVLHTDFNMSVSYMGSGAVQVVLPNHYSDKVCGICGNFNQMMTDDFNLPEGLQQAYALDTGKSWESHDVMCEEPITPRVCTETEELEYSSDLYCGVIISRQGPFAQCSMVLGGESIIQNCTLQMCTAQGDPEVLCHTLQTFSETCNKAGIPVPAWRNSTFCPLVCGTHSHYNTCVSGCQETCASLDAEGTCGMCEERCECDDGFLLDGGTCVLEEDCGCWVNEQHYAIRETFMEGDCDTLCECQGHGKIHCSPVFCLVGEVCMVQDGIKGCFPSSPVTCSVYGDPHYITFDGKAYSFWGTCNYTIVKTCGPADTQFTLTARNEGRENPTSSSLNSIALDMEGFHLTIRKNKLVYVNGARVNLPADFGSVHLSQSGPYAQVDTDFGVRLLFDGSSRLFVQVDERYRGMLCGLCGTYSGSQFDDFLTPDGNNVADPHVFASSWNTDDNYWLCSNGSPDPPACDSDLENAAYTECSALFGDVFTECHWFVPPQIYVTSCITDYCTYQGDTSQLCTSFEDYVSACEVAEVFLTGWRNHTFCDLDPLLPSTNAPKPTSLPDSCKWSCNFDQDDCGWEQLIQDSFDWTRWSGSTPSELTGPTGDHTTGNGFYMYIEGDSVLHGDSARMMTPVCYTFEKQCVSFWYHMYGPANVMALNLYLFEKNRAVKLWSKANNQGNRWFQAKVEIKPQAPFQIIVEGIRGSDPRSDVAIDDVVIRYGECEDIPVDDFDTTTLAPPRTSSNSVIPHPVCGLNCDFESDICSWTQLLTDVFDWTRQIGSTPTLKTGPSSDHTTGSGYYIYIEGDSATHGDTARLLSAECTDIQPQCLQFWYHMHGASSTMGLSVYQLEGNLAQEVWRRRENHGDMWHHALVDLRPTVKFHVIFEGRRGSTALSDVAIDDVSLHRGTCDDLVNQVKPTTPGPLPPTVHTTPGPIQTTSLSFESTSRPTQTTAEPVQTSTRPIQTTAEPFQTTTRPVHSTPEPVQTTSRPVLTTAEPIQTTAEPVQTTTRPVLTTAEPVQTTTRPVLTTAEPIQTTAEPLQTTTRPVQTTAEPIQTTAEPVHTSTRPVQTTAEPVQTTTRPFQTTAEPVQTSTKPVQTTAEPIQTTTRPVQTTAEPVQTTTRPVQTTAEPVQTTTRPVQTTAEPVQTTSRPVQTTAEPVHTTTRPIQTTAAPVQTTTRPVPTTAEPIQTTTRPVHSTPEPVQTTTRPVQTTAEPVHTSTRPVQTTAEPVQTTTRPFQTTAEPVQTSTNPVQTTAEPIQTTTKPIQTTAEPIQTTTRPVQTTAEPVHTTTRPIQTTAAPVQTTTRPVQTTAAPVQTTTRPVQTTAEPVQTTTRPIQTTPEPVQTTTRPVQTTPEPVQTTTRPVHTTNESVQTTAGPIQTTAATPSCPINSHYTDCIPACEPTCSHLHGPSNCNTEEPCVQGCVCDNGFVLKESTCVPISECGCKDSHGNIHSLGEVWYGSHCSQRCECEDDGEIECEDNECDGNEICHVTEQGQHMCQKADFSKCTIDDDPKYRTFDKMKHKFKGEDSYILVQSTNLPSNIPDVYVVTVNKKVKNKSSEEDSSEEDNDDGRLRAIRIRVYNHTVEFKKGRKIMVDGLSVRAPISPSGGIKIWDRSSRVFLKTDFGLFVEFDGKHKAEIILSHMYKIKIGGLCGNFDAVGKNDMMKPNGEQARNVKEFGESWRVTD